MLCSAAGLGSPEQPDAAQQWAMDVLAAGGSPIDGPVYVVAWTPVGEPPVCQWQAVTDIQPCICGDRTARLDRPAELHAVVAADGGARFGPYATAGHAERYARVAAGCRWRPQGHDARIAAYDPGVPHLPPFTAEPDVQDLAASIGPDELYPARLPYPSLFDRLAASPAIGLRLAVQMWDEAVAAQPTEAGAR